MIGFEYRPTDTFLYRYFEVEEKPPYVDVLPVGIGCSGARAPQQWTTSTLEHLDDVDALQIELPLIDETHALLDVNRAVHDLVGWRLLYTARTVAASENAAYVT